MTAITTPYRIPAPRRRPPGHYPTVRGCPPHRPAPRRSRAGDVGTPAPRPATANPPAVAPRPFRPRSADRVRTPVTVWTWILCALLRVIAAVNPRKTGRHRMWTKHRVQHLVRADWRELSGWS